MRAFNVVAEARGARTVSDEEVGRLRRSATLGRPLPEDVEADPTYGRAILLRRFAGRSRLTIFDGGHVGIPAAACSWLERQQRVVTGNSMSR